jgi:hypothetical protein
LRRTLSVRGNARKRGLAEFLTPVKRQVIGSGRPINELDVSAIVARTSRSYDALPDTSDPFPSTHPAPVGATARLFALGAARAGAHARARLRRRRQYHHARRPHCCWRNSGRGWAFGKIDWVVNPALSAAFQALPGTSFVVNGAPAPANSALASVDAELKIKPNWSLRAKFDGELAPGSQTYAGTGTVR